jgi:hypothetical protein
MRQAVRDALIAFMAATSQAQAEATKAAQRAGPEATACVMCVRHDNASSSEHPSAISA